MKNEFKIEGQSFDIGFCTNHKTAESFVAQGVKQGLFASRGTAAQAEILKTAYNKAQELAKANLEELKQQNPEQAAEPSAEAPAKPTPQKPAEGDKDKNKQEK